MLDSLPFIIPQPKVINIEEGSSFCFDPGIEIHTNAVDPRITKILNSSYPEAALVVADTISNTEGYWVTINYEGPIDYTQYQTTAGFNKESYQLKITKDSVIIFSNYLPGLYYGIQTLRQLTERSGLIPALSIIDWPDIGIRGMYFDFRQLVPHFENIIKYIEDYARYKANTLIIEYEDKFPFQVNLDLVNKDFAFTIEQIEMIKETARNNFIDIIPLQQSFGHLEYVLKHERYKSLRETQTSIGELCPLKRQSFEVVTSLLDEMIGMHSEAEYIHIGCDEVWSLCECESCTDRYGSARGKAFIDFVNRLICYTINKGKIPVLWHDMLNKCTEEELKLLDKRVVIMVWLYTPYGVENYLRELIPKFKNAGLKVMGASSVRCHDNRCDQNLPHSFNRMCNVMDWIKAADKFEITSIISTNWATPFALGNVYGIFENTLYISVFSAERYWNKNADFDSFLIRFLFLFHGVEPELLYREIRNKRPEEYVYILNQIRHLIRGNKYVADVIIILGELDGIMNRMLKTNRSTFRYLADMDNETETLFLRSLYEPAYRDLAALRPKLEGALKEFLPTEKMVELFIQSRYSLNDFLKENLYDKIPDIR